jgi:hypothetical protein
MADFLVMDELHLTILAPGKVRDAEYDAIHHSLNSRRLHQCMLGAVR